MLVINQLKNMVFSKMYVSSSDAHLLRFEVSIAKEKTTNQVWFYTCTCCDDDEDFLMIFMSYDWFSSFLVLQELK